MKVKSSLEGKRVARNHDKEKEDTNMKVKSSLEGKRVAYNFIAGALVLLLLFTFLPGCVPAEEEVEEDAYEKYVASLPEGCFPVPHVCFEQAMEEGELFIYEWAEFWPDEIFEGFAEEFGIKVTRDNFAGSSEMMAKFRLYPEAPYDLVTGQGIDQVYHMGEIGALGEIDPDWIPNVWEYIPEELIEMEYDPGWRHSLFCRVWFTTYTYNTKYVDDPRIPSWAVLLDPMEEVKGKITLVDESIEVVGSALKYLGYNWFSDDEGELMEARELLLGLEPHVMAFDGSPLAVAYGDEAWIVQTWYSDSWIMHEAYEAFQPLLPAEGTRVGMSIMFYPIGSPNPAASHLFMNYLFRPEINAVLLEACPSPPIHTAVSEFLSPEAREKGTIPEGYIELCDPFNVRAVEGRGLELRLEIWEELMR